MQRKTSSNAGDDKADVDAMDGLSDDLKSLEQNRSSNLVFGYLNLFSDGVLSMCSWLSAPELSYTYVWRYFLLDLNDSFFLI